MDFVEALDIKSLPPGSHTVISISGKEVYSSILTERLALSETYVYTKEVL